jgi:hypothetical protein
MGSFHRVVVMEKVESRFDHVGPFGLLLVIHGHSPFELKNPDRPRFA